MELLINAIMNQGGDRRKLVAKAFGAGNVIASLQSPTIGELNAAFVRRFLATEGFRLLPNAWAASARCRSISGRIQAR